MKKALLLIVVCGLLLRCGSAEDAPVLSTMDETLRCQAAPPPKQRVGLFYSALQLFAFHAAQAELQQGKPILTVESILRSRQETTTGLVAGAHNFADIWSPNAKKLSANGYYLYTPQTGFYCLYKSRNISNINYDPHFDSHTASDCPMAEHILRQHASMILQLGVDYVVLDGTNISVYGRSGNSLQLRPFELMVQTWYALREAGTATPDVAMWQTIPAGADLWQKILNVYNTYPNMIMKDRHTGKMVMFYKPQTADTALIEQIEANGGRHNVIAVPMWTINPAKPAQWSFLTSCMHPHAYHLADGPCNQPLTPSSVIGSQIAITPMSPEGWPSTGGAKGSSGFAQGIYLRKQFARAMQMQPDYVLLSSWNEHVGVTVHSDYAGGLVQGFEIDPTYTNNSHSPFIDNYSVEYSRNIEPSVEYGSRVYDLVQSCLRVYRTGAKTCNNPHEICCDSRDYSDWYTSYDDANGFFVLYAPHVQQTANMQALYRCKTASQAFLSHDSHCEGINTTSPSMLLGFVSTLKGGETLRTLRRCKTGYAVGVLCPDGSFGDAILGYVR